MMQRKHVLKFIRKLLVRKWMAVVMWVANKKKRHGSGGGL
jgi:hypothetical protein